MAICLAVLAPGSFAVAVEQSPAALRAAFLFQITKFTSWPAEMLAAGQPITSCFVGSNVTDIATIYSQSTAKREIDGHPLSAASFDNWTALDNYLQNHSCHLIVAAKSNGALASVTRHADQGSLLVGMDAQWLKQGGMLALVVDGERITIAINRSNLDASRLRLEPRFLRLAKEL